jgi:hypothetical protein
MGLDVPVGTMDMINQVELPMGQQIVYHPQGVMTTTIEQVREAYPNAGEYLQHARLPTLEDVVRGEVGSGRGHSTKARIFDKVVDIVSDWVIHQNGNPDILRVIDTDFSPNSLEQMGHFLSKHIPMPTLSEVQNLLREELSGRVMMTGGRR